MTSLKFKLKELSILLRFYFHEVLDRLKANFHINFRLRGSLPKSGPLDFATKNTFPLFFVGEEALVGVY